MESMNFAVIGSAHGHITSFIEDMLAKQGNFVGIYDDNSSLASKIAEDYGVPLIEDMEELFNKNVDVAGTSEVNHKKIDVIEKCSEKGVHIIADKPIVVNESQYKRLEKIVDEDKIEIGLMLTVRFMPVIRKVKEIVEENIIGDLLAVEIFSPHSLHPETRPDWHFDKEKNGGIIIDLMIHSVDLYNWLTQDEITDFSGTVQKSILKEKKDFYDSAQIFVESRKGSSGYFRVDWHMSDSHWSWGDLRVFCTGSKGLLEARVIGDPVTQESQVILFEEGEETRRVKIDESKELSVTDDFINRIQGKNYIIGQEDILKATRATIEFDRDIEKIDLTE